VGLLKKLVMLNSFQMKQKELNFTTSVLLIKLGQILLHQVVLNEN